MTLHPYCSINATVEATSASRRYAAYAVAEHSSRLLFTAAAVSIIAFAAFNSPLFGLIAFFAAFRLAPEFQSKVREPLRTHKNENALIAKLWKKTAKFEKQIREENYLEAQAVRLEFAEDTRLIPVLARYLAIEEAVEEAEAKRGELSRLGLTDDEEKAKNAFEIYRVEESDDLDLRRVGIIKGNLEKAFLLHILKTPTDTRPIEEFGAAHPRSRYVRDGAKTQEYFTLKNGMKIDRSEFLDSGKILQLEQRIFTR